MIQDGELGQGKEPVPLEFKYIKSQICWVWEGNECFFIVTLQELKEKELKENLSIYLCVFSL